MNKTFILALGIASTAAIMAAHAQTYQWKDASGRTIISDTPPTTAVKNSRVIGNNQPAVEKEKPADKPEGAPKTSAEKDQDLKKRLQEAKEKSEKDAKEQSAQRDKQENCDRARRNLIALESNQPVATYNDKGERMLMDNTQRQQDIQRAQQFIAENCK